MNDRCFLQAREELHQKSFISLPMGCLLMERLVSISSCIHLVQCMISHRCRKLNTLLYMGKVCLTPEINVSSKEEYPLYIKIVILKKKPSLEQCVYCSETFSFNYYYLTFSVNYCAQSSYVFVKNSGVQCNKLKQNFTMKDVLY